MNKRIEKLIKDFYKAVLNKIVKSSSKNVTINEIIDISHQISNDKDFQRLAAKVSIKIAREALKVNKSKWKKLFKELKKEQKPGIDHTYSKYETKLMKKVANENFKMIKSVPKHILNVYRQKDIKVLIREVAKGELGRGSFEKRLKEHGYKNAALIARTESAKLLSYVDEKRATDLGAVCYEWRSNNDLRTRPSHKDMNGVIVFWRNKKEEKPYLDKMYGNAGEFPNCRCTRLPIMFPERLNKNVYRVYDYRVHKIITMGKNELIEAINKGGL